jgi:hypothetical protein
VFRREWLKITRKTRDLQRLAVIVNLNELLGARILYLSVVEVWLRQDSDFVTHSLSYDFGSAYDAITFLKEMAQGGAVAVVL